MSEFSLNDLEAIRESGKIMDILVKEGIIKEKKFLKQLAYEKELKELQFQMLRLQTFVIENNLQPIVIFEGRDAAGKGGNIKRMIDTLNPKKYRVAALPKPSEKEQKQWYFQRYIKEFPHQGETLFFDRSWYNRAVVEPIFGFCTANQHEDFLQQVVPFEHLLVESGYIVFKFFLSISKEEQAKRLDKRREDPLKRFKIGGLDEQAQEKWDEYEDHIQKMFNRCSSPISPWIEIKTDSKKEARLNAMRYLLNNFPGFKPDKIETPDQEIVFTHC